MNHSLGSSANPVRIAAIGSGPSAFYAAETLFKLPGISVHVDMFDRLPVPFGLVRGGVAPDHQKIKSVVKVYEKIAQNPGFRFFGNVQIGTNLQVQDLAAHYHMVIWAIGCEADLKLGAPGEDLSGVHSATEFVGWYNGHPDFRSCKFDLANAERVALIGNGNVAMDVARILLCDPEHLASTDIAEHALATLKKSRVREVVLLGRRGPAQAAFSPKELEEITALPGVDVVVQPKEAQLDELSLRWLEQEGARSAQRNVKLVEEIAGRGEGTAARKLRCRFLVSPVELIGSDGRLTQVRLQHAVLGPDASGTPRPKPLDSFETLKADLVFKAIGYRGRPLAGVPFDEKKGIVLNAEGRVLEKAGGAPLAGHYAVGWCKRGPTGLIGTNSADSKATVEAMLADLTAGKVMRPTGNDIRALLEQRSVDFVSWQDWLLLDAWEQEQGKAKGKVRLKQPSIEALMAAVRELRQRGAA